LQLSSAVVRWAWAVEAVAVVMAIRVVAWGRGAEAANSLALGHVADAGISNMSVKQRLARA